MSENFKERLEDIHHLTTILDTVNNTKSERDFCTDIKKYSTITFNNKGSLITIDVYEVTTYKNGELFHEFYDANGNMLISPVADKDFINGQSLNNLNFGTFDKNSLLYNVYQNQDCKSLSELEEKQTKEIADKLGLSESSIKEMTTVQFSDPVKSTDEISQKLLEQYRTMGMEIDTGDLATSEVTIKEFLNVDADKLLAVQINGTWKVFCINDDGSIDIEDNLQIIDNNQPFHTINELGPESRIPEIEFRRKDNPDYSLAIDSLNDDNKTQAFLIAGNSRTASEIEASSLKSPYADTRNNELLQEAQENPDEKVIVSHKKDVDPHEPSFPEERTKYHKI